MCLNHFARVDRLDVLRELLVGDECQTTYVVLDEIRRGVSVQPILQAALELEWVRPIRLETLSELECFAKWVGRIGAGERNLGEASVFAVAELRHGIAVTDDQPATRVARAFGLEVHGTVWVLARACRDGKLTVTAAGSLVDMLRASDMRLPVTGPEFESWARQRGLL
jgi:predicted nucleic acid-binding protein